MLKILKTYQKQIIFFLKISIVFIAFFFMYNKVIISFNRFTFLSVNKLLIQLKDHLFLALFIFLLSFFNWFFEFYKWKILVSKIKKITLFQSINQCLGSLTVSIITPNRVGEYGAKALFYLPPYRKQIVALNLVGNLTQLLITFLFGTIGLLYIITNYGIDFSSLNFTKIFMLIFILILILIGIYFGLKRMNYWQKLHSFFKDIDKKIYQKVIVLSLLRYLIFSHQFYFLTVLFALHINYQTAMLFIFTMYLLASILPSLALLDWIIKGSVAVFLFSLLITDTTFIFIITSLMWLLNFAIPSIIGSYYVLIFKPLNIENDTF